MKSANASNEKVTNTIIHLDLHLLHMRIALLCESLILRIIAFENSLSFSSISKFHIRSSSSMVQIQKGPISFALQAQFCIPLQASAIRQWKCRFNLHVKSPCVWILRFNFMLKWVVKYLLASYDIVDATDNEGNAALHVAAFRGHLPVAEALISSSPSSLSSLTNNAGYTFLHMAVEGFRAPGFRRLDRQMDLMKELISGKLIEIQNIINIQNNEGRTALHMALIGTVHSDLVELLMAARSINLNIRDIDGMTPLDLLRKNQRSVSSEILIKRLVSFGGISNSKNYIAKSAIASHFKMHGLGNSPGTSFRISDAEIFLYADIEAPEDSGRLSSCSSASQSEISQFSPTGKKYEFLKKKKNSFYKVLLKWRRKGKKSEKLKKLEEEVSLDSFQKWSPCVEIPTPLRQRFCKSASLLNNKRTYAVNNSMPSPDTMKRFTASLSHGVIQPTPDLARTPHSPSSSFSRSPTSSPHFDKRKGDYFDDEKNGVVASCSNSSAKSGKLMNKYFSFGAQGSNRKFERSVLSVA